jgi:chemotaxis protein methyltransferase CheR
MTATADYTRLAQLAAHLSRFMGLNFPTDRLAQLQRGLKSACRDFGFQSVDSCMEWLLSSSLTQQQIEILATHLTVGETYFFREKKSLEFLKNNFLREIHPRPGADRHIRIWSAGCASGEEPYSIAISLAETIPDIAGWNITILATDINSRSLQKAARGIYSKWSFRDCPPLLQQKYFKKTGENQFEIVPAIKAMVSFAYHNLAADPYPSILNNTNAVDMIFCRNVLMYFTRDAMHRVIRKLHQCLVDGGMLIVSPAEASQPFSSVFLPVGTPDGTLYKKARINTSTPVGEVNNSEPLKAAKSATRPAGTPSSTTEPGMSSRVAAGPEPLAAGAEIKTQIAGIDLCQNAETLFTQGSYADAENIVYTLLQDHPECARAIALEARILANQGKLTEGANWCHRAISQDKLNPAYHYLLATVLHEQGQLEEAAGELKRAIYLDPGFVLAYFALGNLSLRTGKLEESTRHLKNVLSLLKRYHADDILPESDGITAGRLAEAINSCLEERL